MRHYTMLRLLLAGFLFYIAWPYISLGTTLIEKVFWISWLSFLLLVVGSNFATILQLSRPPVMEEKIEQVRERG